MADRTAAVKGKVVRTEGVSLYHQTANVLKEHIEQNELQPGDKLPTIRGMVRSLGISEATLGRALNMLEAEGLIQRRHGWGIAVADRNVTGEIAIVVKDEFLSHDASPFFRLVCSAISKTLHERDPRCRVRLHVGKPVGPESFIESLHLLEPETLRRLRGVFSLCNIKELSEPLGEKGVPIINVGALLVGEPADRDCRVSFNNRALLTKALAHLRQAGCRSVGVIGGQFFSDVDEPFFAVVHREIEEQLQEFDFGGDHIRLKNAVPCERLGYEMFRDFWQSGARPEGLVVLDDIMCHGVLRATLQFGIHLPEGLRLVTQANRGVDFPYHLDVTRVEYDPQRLACKAVEMMGALLEGEEVAEGIVTIEPEFVKGETV